jgi:hypothetical protein
VTTELIYALIAFQVKHFICDYPLQNQYMLGKFKPFPQFVKPLLAHAGVHGFMTFVTLLFLFFSNLPGKFILTLAVADFLIHATVDLIKANKHLLGRWKPDQSYFWWALGWDQMMHHFTHYAIIYIAMRNTL